MLHDAQKDEEFHYNIQRLSWKRRVRVWGNGRQFQGKSVETLEVKPMS